MPSHLSLPYGLVAFKTAQTCHPLLVTPITEHGTSPGASMHR